MTKHGVAYNNLFFYVNAQSSSVGPQLVGDLPPRPGAPLPVQPHVG
jgi:hypothetical protein